jgi:hypothetical protein
MTATGVRPDEQRITWATDGSNVRDKWIELVVLLLRTHFPQPTPNRHPWSGRLDLAVVLVHQTRYLNDVTRRDGRGSVSVDEDAAVVGGAVLDVEPVGAMAVTVPVVVTF